MDEGLVNGFLNDRFVQILILIPVSLTQTKSELFFKLTCIYTVTKKREKNLN